MVKAIIDQLGIELLLIIWGLLTLFAAIIASLKGRSAIVWLNVGLIFGPLALIAAIIMPGANRKPGISSGKTLFEQGSVKVTESHLATGRQLIELSRIQGAEVSKFGQGLYQLRLIDRHTGSRQVLTSVNQRTLLRIVEAIEDALARQQRTATSRGVSSNSQPGDRHNRRPVTSRLSAEITALNQRRRQGDLTPEQYHRLRDRLNRRRA